MRLSEELRGRTKRYASAIIRCYVKLPKEREEVRVLGKQLLRSGTSVAAHSREASRARSDSEFCSKLDGLLQEAMSRSSGLNCCVMIAVFKASRSISCCVKPMNCSQYSPAWSSGSASPAPDFSVSEIIVSGKGDFASNRQTLMAAGVPASAICSF
jgi:four helix bundle protein